LSVFAKQHFLTRF